MFWFIYKKRGECCHPPLSEPRVETIFSSDIEPKDYKEPPVVLPVLSDTQQELALLPAQLLADRPQHTEAELAPQVKAESLEAVSIHNNH